jgi:hypothetical protein
MSRGHKKIEKDLTGRFIRVGRDRSTVTLDARPRWRILVPVADNDGLVFTDRHRKKLDDRVLKVSGGSTENPWSNGKWRKGCRLYKEPMIPLEFHATTEQAFGIAAFARGHFNQEEIELRQIADPVYRIRNADQAKPSKLARVRQTIWRRIRRTGREFFAMLQRSRENGRRPAEGRRHREVGHGLADAATAQAESRRGRGPSPVGNRRRTSTKAAKRRRPHLEAL